MMRVERVSLPARGRGLQPFSRGPRRGARVVVLAGLFGCGGEDSGVSFEREVKPLFEARCVTCHHSENLGGLVDIEDPFTLDEPPAPPGLVGSKNIWAEGHPGYSPEYNLVPFEPEASFLMQKVTGRDLIPSETGFRMPPPPRRLKDPQLQAIRQWIADGANDDEFYRDNVFGIFGDLYNRHGLECERSGLDAGCIVCVTCHYPGSPDPPDFSQPFDPVVGVVGVSALFRPDLKLVEPGNPDASFLVMKLEAMEASPEVGAPMPYGYPPLSEAQAEILRQWIIEGARDN